MKILKTGYNPNEEEVLIFVEGYPKTTFCIDLKKMNSKQDVIDELKKKLNIVKPNKYEDYKLKELEGADI